VLVQLTEKLPSLTALIKPEDAIQIKTEPNGGGSIALEKLLKQDLDINTQELEELMDNFDLDELINMKKPGSLIATTTALPE
jgi:hypothetical protein